MPLIISFILIRIHLIYNVILVSGVQHSDRFSSIQSLSYVQLFGTPWTVAHQASLSVTISQSLLSSCPLNWWCHPTISSSVVPFSSFLQSFPASGSFPMSQFFASGGQSIGSFSFSISSSNEYSGLISFRMDWLDLLAVQGTFKSLLQHQISKVLYSLGSAWNTFLHLSSWIKAQVWVNEFK